MHRIYAVALLGMLGSESCAPAADPGCRTIIMQVVPKPWGGIPAPVSWTDGTTVCLEREAQ